jgi:hypothetical protein
MKQKKILLVTTFREFNDGIDANIQTFFLKKLEEQTYKNFELIVTSFQEKKVLENLKKTNLNFSFYQSNSKSIYSLTEMLINSINHIVPDETIVVLTTADHILDPNYFQILSKVVTAGVSGTCFPNYQYLSVEDYIKRNPYNIFNKRYSKHLFSHDPNAAVPETFFYDGNLLLNETVQETYRTHWIEGFITGIDNVQIFGLVGEKHINIYPLTKVHNILNESANEGYHKQLSHILVSPDPNSQSSKNQIICSLIRKALNKKDYNFVKSSFFTRKMKMFLKFKVIGSKSDVFKHYMYIFFYLMFPRGDFLPVKIYRKITKFF